MKYEWMDSYFLSKKCAEKTFKTEWGTTLYLIGGKMFAMLGGDKYGKPIITLKCEPMFGKMLRETYKDITPGYYMNKVHWNSLYLEGEVPDDVLKQMIDMSYTLVLEALPKKIQKEISEK